MNWTILPVARPLIAWVAAMLIASQVHFQSDIWLFGALVFLCSFLLLSSQRHQLQKRKHLLSGIFLLGLYFAVGGGLYVLKREESAPLEKLMEKGEKRSFTLTLVDGMPSASGAAFRARIDGVATDTSAERQLWPDIIIRFHKKDTVSRRYAVFDQLVIHAVVQPVKKSTNPEAFDYAAYLKYKGIGGQAFVGEHCHQFLKRANASWLQTTARQVNTWMKQTIQSGISSPHEQAVLIALLSGDDALIADEVYQAYSATGAVHVLSVSGLHVAIFIGAFVWLFSLLPTRSPYVAVGKLIFLLLLIGFYTLITGLSASVVRSGLMIAFVLVARTWHKNTHAMHVLTLAALGMLAYNPYYLHQVSFQFSYLSLISILYFEPSITPLLQPDTWLGRQAWQLTSVSLAAQILMIPWSLWYFHQLSLTFVVSGFVAVPLVTAIMYAGSLLLLGEALFAYVPAQIYLIVSSLVNILNRFILWLGNLPFASLTNVWQPIPVFICLLACQLFFMTWLSNRKGVNLQAMGMSITAAVFFVQLHLMQREHAQGLIVYDVPGKTLIDVFAGPVRLTWANVEESSKTVQFAAKGFRIRQGLVMPVKQSSRSGAYCLGNQQVFVIASHLHELNIPHFRHADVVIDTGFADQPPEEVLSATNPYMVVLANGVGWKRRNHWLRLAKANSFSVHIVQSQGAFILENL